MPQCFRDFLMGLIEFKDETMTTEQTAERVRKDFEAWYKLKHGFTGDHILFHTWDRNGKFINYEHRPLRDSWASYQAAIESQASIISGLKAQVAGLEKDAARYQWLRAPTSAVGLVIDKVSGEHEGLYGEAIKDYEYRAGEELDIAIDAAMNTPIPGESNE